MCLFHVNMNNIILVILRPFYINKKDHLKKKMLWVVIVCPCQTCIPRMPRFIPFTELGEQCSSHLLDERVSLALWGRAGLLETAGR